MGKNLGGPMWAPVLGCACAVGLSACDGGSKGSDSPAVAAPDGPLTATLSVESSDPDGHVPVHEWHVTAGTLSASNGRTVKWTLPEGGGLQFAYLTVSDGHGAYVERTLALELGTPGGTPVVANPRAALYPVPARESFEGAPLRGTFSIERPFAPNGRARTIYLPNEAFRLTATSIPTPFDVYNGMGISQVSDAYGEVRMPRLPAGTWQVSCNGDPATDCRGGNFAQGALQTHNQSQWLKQIPPPASAEFRLYGHVSLRDGVLCGLSSPYKRKAVGATVRYGVLEAAVNAYGDYAMRIPAGTALPPTLTVQCEGSRADVPAPVAELSVESASVEMSVTLANSAPLVSAITATANGEPVGAAVVDESFAPSNAFARPDHFLTYKGQDTADSACAYYLAIGATPRCGANGSLPPDAIRFDEWKRMRRLAPYDTANPEVRATYVNHVDLNLVRDMHGVKNGSDDLAFYVCNYPKPKSTLQADVDAAIADAQAGRNLVACVAMDYSVTPGTHGDRPFTKFYVFGPAGQLISSVNLDGRGEKFVPGACVVCHGASGYEGRFPQSTFPLQAASNGPSASIGARFLPFDLGNYRFSSAAGLRKADQQLSLKRLNFLVRDIENDMAFVPPTTPGPPGPVVRTAAMTLIDGWYASNLDRDRASDLDEHYVPEAWTPTVALERKLPSPETAPTFYREVIARSCRTCHVALPNADWDQKAPAGNPHVCGGSSELMLNGKMANSKVTFDLMWLTAFQVPEYRQLLGTHLGCGAAGVGISAPFPNP